LTKTSCTSSRTARAPQRTRQLPPPNVLPHTADASCVVCVC
jgi:hypothetical protein